jgi:hypothetical protein
VRIEKRLELRHIVGTLPGPPQNPATLSGAWFTAGFGPLGVCVCVCVCVCGCASLSLSVCVRAYVCVHAQRGGGGKQAGRSVAWHSTAQHSTAQHSTAQHSTAQHITSHGAMYTTTTISVGTSKVTLAV